MSHAPIAAASPASAGVEATQPAELVEMFTEEHRADTRRDGRERASVRRTRDVQVGDAFSGQTG